MSDNPARCDVCGSRLREYRVSAASCDSGRDGYPILDCPQAHRHSPSELESSQLPVVVEP